MIQRRSPLLYIVVLAGSSLAIAQNSPGAAPGQSSPSEGPATPPSTTVVPENTAVITIDGVCELSLNGMPKPALSAHPAAVKSPSAKTAPPPSSAPCKTQITRAEFEKLLKTVAPGAPATVNRQIATRYVQLLTAANQGIKLGIEKEPGFDEQLAIARLQVLAQLAERKLQTEAQNVSEADEKTYYDQNPSAFEEVTLSRIFIPRNPSTAAGAAQPQTSSPDPQTVAEDARKQLAAGDDPEKVEKAAYEQLKNTTTPPSTKFGARRRGSLPPTQEQKVFALNQGDVSEVFSDSIGYAIYKIDSKTQLPFDQMKDDIKRKLTQQHLEDTRAKIMNASRADYNDSYFGPEAAARPAPSKPAVIPPGSAPGSRPSTIQPTTPK